MKPTVKHRVELRPQPSILDLTHIMQNLRPLDRIEVDATHWSDVPRHWATTIHQAGEFQWAAYLDGMPVASIGAVPRWTGNKVWSAWCLGTEDFPRVALSVSRHVRHVMLPAVFAAGMERGDAFVYEPYTQACKWLEILGAKREATLAKWGKNGETFVSYIWLREQHRQTPERATGAVASLPDGLSLVRAEG